MQTAKQPWTWIPSLYFTQGIPYVIVMSLATIMYKDFGVSNADIALYTSWLYLPWVIKPLWSPLVDMFGTKRLWTVCLQFIVGAALAAVAFTIQMPAYFQISLAVFWLMAFSSATHDIAADGFYMLGVAKQEQAAYVGVRSLFYRIAMISGQGGLTIVAGKLTQTTADVHMAWSLTFALTSILFLLLASYHGMRLPRPAEDQPAPRHSSPLADFLGTFASFFKKKDIGLVLAFLLTFRLGEAQLVKLVAPFLRDPLSAGGLGLSTIDVGFAYGTVGIGALICGGLLGGVTIARFGLKRCLIPMLFAIHVPDLAFVYLAQVQPHDMATITSCIALEQFGYGFGFTAYMLFMISVAEGEHKTAHFAICTGFMALGMMVPGMVSGKIQEYLGYPHFFMWVCIATLPSFVVAAFLKIESNDDKA